ncbi:MAG: VWA domain-containing protein [bacterium]|nr:VWA domain-containing protein [bacterium]
MTTSKRKRRQKGTAIVITAVSMMLIIPVVGLAIDASFLYAVRARLSAGADAAALAAARALNKGLTLGEQEAEAIARAHAFFDANFPDGFLATSGKVVDVSVAETDFRTRSVFVEATVDANSYFMRAIGVDSSTIGVEGKASRRDVNLMLVLDRSGSMDASNSCEPMKAAARQFVSQFASGRDRLGLITFGMTYLVAYDPSMDFKTSSPTLDSVLSGIDCWSGTGTAQGLWQSFEELETINEPGTLNLVVFFSDGLPNGLTAEFPVKQRTDFRYSYSNPGSGTWMDPSPCLDASGERYDRRPGEDEQTFFAPGWNPNWFPDAKTGVMAAQGNATASTGGTFGITNTEAISVSEHNRTVISDSNGCKFAGNGGSDWGHMRRDVAYIPDEDVYENSTLGSFGYSDPPEFTGGFYDGRIRPDKPNALGAASKNAADNAARRMRQDPNLQVLIYSIGLGDPSGAMTPPDPEFMKRVANDPESPVYTEDEPTGFYAFAPDNTQLSQAFARVASEILRLSR